MAERKRKTAPTKKSTARLATTGTTIRLEQPKSKRGKPTASEVAVVVAQEVNPVSGFVGFLREHSVVGVAIGFAIATQVQVVIKQLITSFIDPMYALLFNGEKLSAKTYTLHWHDRAQIINWGAFVYTLMDLIFVLLVLYLIVKFFNLDKLEKPKEEEKK